MRPVRNLDLERTGFSGGLELGPFPGRKSGVELFSDGLYDLFLTRISLKSDVVECEIKDSSLFYRWIQGEIFPGW